MQTSSKAIFTCLFSVLLVLTTPICAQENHAPLNKFQWTYDTDPYGSEAIINEKLIRHGGIWIKFKRVARINAERNTWAELIYKLPKKSLEQVEIIKLTYQSENALIATLPQVDFDENGDETRSYYQTELPATKQWITKEMPLESFKRTNMMLEVPQDKLNPAQVKTISFAPKLSDEQGGEVIIQVRAIELLP